MFYATDLGELPGKFSSALPDAPAAKPRQQSIRVARVRFEGDPQHPANWDAAAACWRKFAPYVRHVTGCTLEEAAPVRPGEDKLAGIALLHLCGRGQVVLTEKQRAALKEFVQGGGTLLVNAYAGSPAFAASARAELEALFGPLKPLAAEHPLAEGRFEGGSDLSTAGLKLPLRQLLRRRDESPRGQKLLVYQVKNRPAVVFSSCDLTAAMAGIENYRSLGYKPDSARKIVANLLALMVAD